MQINLHKSLKQSTTQTMVAIRRSKKSQTPQNIKLVIKVFIGIGFIGTILGLLVISFVQLPSTTVDNVQTVIERNTDVVVSSTNGNAGSIRKVGSTVEIDTTRKENSEIIKDPEPEEVELKQNKTDMKPKKPLRQTNKDIISTTPMVDIRYVDVSNNNEEDPHRGATDENGEFGYRHDEKALKNNPPIFQVAKSEVNCDNHDGNYKMLTEKVVVDFTSHEAREREAEAGGKPRAKLFCMVYTIEKNHDKIPAIRETWGQKCDGFIVASDKTDKSLGTVNIPHEGEEEYHNIWQKVRSMWSYVYDNYYEDYDWFHIGGDDLYVIVENMRLYLESDEVQLASNGGEYLPSGDEKEQLPLFLGRRFAEQGNYERIFNSGGSGYTMNKAALKSLVVTAFPVCMPHLHTFAEDVMVAQCFRNKIQVYPFDTKDDNGGERYMPFTVSICFILKFGILFELTVI